MSALNNCSFVGRVITDKIETDNSGERPRVKFSISVRRGQGKADFIPCTAWGPQAEFAAKYLKKGMPITVRGEFRSNRLETEGNVRWFYGIDVYDINFVPNEAEEAQQQSASRAQPKSVGRRYGGSYGGSDDPDESPF